MSRIAGKVVRQMDPNESLFQYSTISHHRKLFYNWRIVGKGRKTIVTVEAKSPRNQMTPNRVYQNRIITMITLHRSIIVKQ